MPAALVAILAALPQILGDIPGFVSAYNDIKAALSAPTQAAIDGIIAGLQSKTSADVATLEADAAAGAAGQ